MSSPPSNTPTLQPAPAVTDAPATWFAWSAWRSMGALAADWGLILGAIAVAIMAQQAWVTALAFILIARTQLALAVMMHEAAHGVLHPTRRVNDVLGQWCAAGPLGLKLYTYRFGHLRHHQAPMSADDPVSIVFGITDFPVPPRTLVLRLLGDACGIGYLLSARKLLRGHYAAVLTPPPSSASWRCVELASFLVPNALLAGGLWALGHGTLYWVLWVLPALTLLPLFGRLRAIMEHAGYPATVDQRLNARTIVRASWQTFLCGPHAIHFHIEHHLYVRAPFYHLAEIHRDLKARNALPHANLYQGYGKILYEVTRLPATSTP